MPLRTGWAGFALLAALLAGCASGGDYAGGLPSSPLECVPFARQVSGIPLYGEAYSWWNEASGRYPRSQAPAPGSVLVFRRSNRLPYGHVSVVSVVENARQIRVTQANWVHHHIGRDEPVVDVSPGNDWSAVRVWWAPSHQLGVTVYPTYGFILPGNAAPARGPLANDRVSQMIWPPSATGGDLLP